MSNLTVKVSGLSKAYSLGIVDRREKTLIDAILSSLIYPFRNYKSIKALKKANPSDESIFWANRDITFEVKKGEVLGIIGKNGAGKSTLLKMLSRITQPTYGRIDLYGRVASLLEVGTGFNPELTGKENIYLNGTILGLTKKEIDKEFDSIIEFSGIQKFIDTPVKRYSSGMKVRLAFAVAAHLNPEILIIDEVLAVGDAEFQKKCVGKMEQVSKGEGRTVIFVSHDMAAVKKMCDRAILLEQGKIIKEGDPSSVIDFYLQNVGNMDQLNDAQLMHRRKGNGKFILVGLEFLDEKNVPLKIVKTGMNIQLRMLYKMHEQGPHPVVNLIFRNNLHQQVINLLSRDSYEGIIKLSREGEIVISIPHFPLLPGRYTVDFNLKYDQEITDAAESIVTIDVEKGDFFGTGKLSESLKNGFLTYHTWEIK